MYRARRDLEPKRVLHEHKEPYWFSEEPGSIDCMLVLIVHIHQLLWQLYEPYWFSEDYASIDYP